MTWISVFITLCLVIDPFGAIPVLLSQIPQSKTDLPKYRRIILREGFIALGVLVCFMFSGNFILKTLDLSRASLGIAGSIVLFMIALRMIFPRPSGDMLTGGRKTGEPLVVPIAIPLIAGPSSMTMVMLIAGRHPQQWPQLLGAIMAAWAVTVVIFLAAPLIMKLLGSKVMEAVERLMGMILVTVAVQMMLTGIKLAMELPQ